MTAGTGTGTGIAAELRAFRSGAVWGGLGLTAVAQVALFASVTYLAPMVAYAGLAEHWVPVVLIVFGVGSCVGIYAGGRVPADRSRPGLAGGLLAVTAVLVVMDLGLRAPAVVVGGFLLLGVSAFFLAPLLQVRVLQAATAAPTLVSAANQGAFNVGNAAGALVGGVAIDRGLGDAAPNGAGAVFSLAALVLLLLVGRPRPSQV